MKIRKIKITSQFIPFAIDIETAVDLQNLNTILSNAEQYAINKDDVTLENLINSLKLKIKATQK